MELQNGAHLKKKIFFDLLFTFLVTRGKTLKSFSTHPTYVHTPILLTLLTRLSSQFAKIANYHVWLLFGVWLLVLILIRAILEQSTNKKMVNKIEVRISTNDINLP